jgi:5-methylcytosine-specific restriction protein A
MTKRQRLSRLHRTRIYDANDGVCCICGLQIQGKRFVVEHVKPLWLGGADDDTNRKPAHEKCAIAKTVSEAPVKAKTDRQRANHLGIRKTTRQPIRSRGFAKAPPQRSATRPIERRT